MKKLIKKILILFFVFTLIPDGHSQWYSQNSNTNSFLHSIFFINKSTGWVCGFESVLKTTDCGNTWTNNFLEGYHLSIFFTDINSGWICGENGRLYKSTNSGTTWVLMNSGTTNTLNQITFLNDLEGLLVGNNRTILRTTNGGVNWFSIITGSNSLNIHAVKILNQNNFYATSSISTVYKTTNSGITWDTTWTGFPNPLLTVDFINENTGWISGCCGMYMKTTNGGVNWTPDNVYLTLGFSINSMHFINENSGWMAGDAGYILRTTNGGSNWDSVVSNTNYGLKSIFFVNKDTGFVAGYNGLILRTTNGGGTGFPIGINQISSVIPDDFFLHQNYPNPFNPTTTINYDLHVETNNYASVQLKVYDNLGKELETLVSEKQNAGSYSVNWDAGRYATGIYFYKLISGEYESVKKMILIK